MLHWVLIPQPSVHTSTFLITCHCCCGLCIHWRAGDKQAGSSNIANEMCSLTHMLLGTAEALSALHMFSNKTALFIPATHKQLIL
jgi:hypothetical protein